MRGFLHITFHSGRAVQEVREHRLDGFSVPVIITRGYVAKATLVGEVHPLAAS